MIFLRVVRKLVTIFYFFSGYKFKTVGFFCKIRGKSISTGKNVSIGDFCWIECVNQYKLKESVQNFQPEIILEDDVAMSDFVHISAVKRIRIGSGTLIGSKVYIGDHSHGSYTPTNWSTMAHISPRFRPLDDVAEISIGKNCWIGDGAVILAGTVIGDNCVIGANSVVKGKFSSNQIIAGIPAKVVKEMSL
jgi:lipopolysaccharide O-acetyltransferase